MKLNEIFSDDFISRLNRLNEGAEINSDQEVSGYIDVKKILHELKFNLYIENQMTGSGQIRGKDIYIDGSENEQRQRFSMAHELGHAMQNNRYANRNDDSDDYSSEDRQDEVFANTFAAQFLMPKVLVMQSVIKIIREREFDRHCLQSKQVNVIIQETAKTMKVSTMAMKYRIDDLGIFIPAKVSER